MAGDVDCGTFALQAPRINRSWNVANSTNLCRGSSILLTEAKTRKTCGSANVKFLHWNDSETTVGVKMTNSKNRKLAAKNKVGRTALVRPIPIDPKNGVYALNRALGGFLGINANGSLISQVYYSIPHAQSRVVNDRLYIPMLMFRCCRSESSCLQLLRFSLLKSGVKKTKSQTGWPTIARSCCALADQKTPRHS